MFTAVTTADYQEYIAGADNGILLCMKPLCPHCKNMEKVLEKFTVQHAHTSIFTLDTEVEPAAMQALGAERAPTLFLIKNGTIVCKKAGLMNPKELGKLYTENGLK